jgi:carbonic anhydrase
MLRLHPSIALFVALVASPALAAPADPLQALKDGNARFIADKPVHPREDASRRAQTASGQDPFAIILACADSRVAPELVFDQGVGDVFDIRVAGNVAGTDEVASIEYAVEHLHTPLLVVMGHSSCGAVAAAVERPAAAPVRVMQLIAPIFPAVEQARAANPTLKGPDLVAAAVRANAMLQVRTLLRSSDIVRDAVRGGKLQVVGAVYDLPSGKVEFLGAHPEQAQLVAEPDNAPTGSTELKKAAR